MTFYQYLAPFQKENSTTGDVAKDVYLDPNFPKRATSLKTILKYLNGHDASIHCLEAVCNAHDDYKDYLLTK